MNEVEQIGTKYDAAQFRLMCERLWKVVQPRDGLPCEVLAIREIERLRKIEADAKAANLIGPDGNVRKVLGTLPVTADGCVVGECSPELWWYQNDNITHDATKRLCVHDIYEMPVEYTYSTREAAEAARNNSTPASERGGKA